MQLTLQKGYETVGPGQVSTRYFSFTGPSSYATGGIAIIPQDAMLKSIISVANVAGNTGGGPYYFYYNNQTGKVQIFTGGTEVTNATNLSSYTWILEISGI
jgi:hypothetical protein